MWLYNTLLKIIHIFENLRFKTLCCISNCKGSCVYWIPFQFCLQHSLFLTSLIGKHLYTSVDLHCKAQTLHHILGGFQDLTGQNSEQLDPNAILNHHWIHGWTEDLLRSLKSKPVWYFFFLVAGWKSASIVSSRGQNSWGLIPWSVRGSASTDYYRCIGAPNKYIGNTLHFPFSSLWVEC